MFLSCPPGSERLTTALPPYVIARWPPQQIPLWISLVELDLKWACLLQHQITCQLSTFCVGIGMCVFTTALYGTLDTVLQLLLQHELLYYIVKIFFFSFFFFLFFFNMVSQFWVILLTLFSGCWLESTVTIINMLPVWWKLQKHLSIISTLLNSKEKSCKTPSIILVITSIWFRCNWRRPDINSLDGLDWWGQCMKQRT